MMDINAQGVKQEQKTYPRVRKAYQDKGELINNLLSDKGIQTENLELFVRAFKKERKLEIWGKNIKDTSYQIITIYDFCASSGHMGPKRKEGDKQIPEGIYFIDRFNPSSNFYLSLGINYPNASDRRLSPHQNLGGDIFIHGNCVTRGCIPITDDKIKELYILAVEASNNGQSRIAVHIFPSSDFESLYEHYKDKTGLTEFWKELETIYQRFEEDKTLN